MGTLRSASDCSGLVINGVTLGDPTFTNEMQPDANPILFAWDDSRLPNGVIEDDGTITFDQSEDDL
jgi:hypothetical protein